MRNYTVLHATYVRGQAEQIKSVLPERANVCGGVRGLTNDSDSYDFEPPLTQDEMVGLTGKLIDLGVKKFSFEDTRSLGEAD